MFDKNESEILDGLLKSLELNYTDNQPISFNSQNILHLLGNFRIKEDISVNQKAILGIDIYQYSQFEIRKQILIPIVFDLIYTAAMSCLDSEATIFIDYNFKDNFISTGDGGYQIFDNLLQAIVYNFYFHMALQQFNSQKTFSDIGKIINEIVIRSCITFDFVYKYKGIYYGTAIINNARILSKDKLNRFLLDYNTYLWFQKNAYGIENLSKLTLNEIKELLKITSEEDKSSIFTNGISNNINICLVQKIGEVFSKKNRLDVFNLYIQIYFPFKRDSNFAKIITIGNLNTSGIIDEI